MALAQKCPQTFHVLGEVDLGMNVLGFDKTQTYNGYYLYSTLLF